MILDINDKLLIKIKSLLEKRSKNLLKELNKIKPIKNISDNNQNIENARNQKTSQKKDKIKNSILELKKDKINISKYQIHKKTGIAYVTINKYYDEIINNIK